MDICLDNNIIIDLLIPERNGHLIAKNIYDIIKEKKYVNWISASSICNLDNILSSEIKKFNLNEPEKIRSEFRRFLLETKIFTATGASIRDALNAEDFENHIIHVNFKRIAPDGILISNNTGPKDNYGAVRAEDFIKDHESLSKPVNIPLLDLKEEYRFMLEDIDNGILKNIANTMYILGPEVKELEDKVAKYIGVNHCIGISSGTDALVLALRSLALKIKGEQYWSKDDLIITTPFTFTATGDSILRAGATPLFVDIDYNTYNIDPAKIKECLTYYSSPQTKGANNVVGILPVHLYGKPSMMDDMSRIAKEHNLFVLEDVAQAFGGQWHNCANTARKLGSIGTAGCFSFFPSKNLGGFGDGGMVSTDDNEIAELIRMLLRHGGKDKYNVDHIGYNARLDTIQAAIILVKFKFIDDFNEKRRKIADIYSTELNALDGILLPAPASSISNEGKGHVYHQYTIRVLNGRRDALQKYLKDKSISSMIYYPIPLNDMKVFNGRMKTYGNLNSAKTATKEVLSIPIEPLQKEKTTKYIVDTIKEFFQIVKN
ncbi:pleiotropic regulatory protein DegT [Candidatus Magnetoovum chiemensis]|nr:pleiotropic regulatory protein DegT [Candidatus Magnetoovum chiemensis]